MRFLVTTLIAATAVVGILAVVRTDRITGNVTPGDSLYSVDRWMERVKERFAHSDEEKAATELENAEERLEELTQSAANNDIGSIETSARGFQESLTSALEHAYNVAEPTVRTSLTQTAERIAQEAKPLIADVTARVEKETQKALAVALVSIQDEIDAALERIKKQAQQEIQEEINALGDRLKETLKEQLQAIGNNLKKNETDTED